MATAEEERQRAARAASKQKFIADRRAADRAADPQGLSIAERAEASGFGVAREQEFPANSFAGLTTPPPDPVESARKFVERNQIDGPPDATPVMQRPIRELVGEAADAVGASDARNVGAATREGVDTALEFGTRPIRSAIGAGLDNFDRVRRFGQGFFGIPPQQAAAVDGPTGSRPVSTRDQAGPESQFTDGTLTGQGEDLDALVEEQANQSAHPGQQSNRDGDGVGLPPPPDGAVQVIRGTRVTNDQPLSGPGPDAGLKIPIGFDEPTGRRIAAMMNLIPDPQEAIAAMAVQDDAAARLINAGANSLNAHANATNRFSTPKGIVFSQIDGDGNLGFIDTGFQEIIEPKVGNKVTQDGITGDRTSVPVLLYPVFDVETGEPVIDPASGQQDVGAIPFDRLGIGANDVEAQQKAVREWQELTRGGSTPDEIIEAMREL